MVNINGRNFIKYSAKIMLAIQCLVAHRILAMLFLFTINTLPTV